MLTDFTFYAAAIPAVFLLGLAKGGFTGMGALSLPLLALAIDPIAAAAILLPILIAQDVVGVWAFRKTVDWTVLGWTLPGACAGILLGYIYAKSVTPEGVLAGVGVISILFGMHRLWLDARDRSQAKLQPGWVGIAAGLASGFTSQIAHAGGPPYQLYVLPRKLPRDILVGTTAIFFAVVNLVKVPAYLALGQFTAENMMAAAVLMPAAILSTFAGVWLVRRVSPQRFYTSIYCLMILVGAKLVWDVVG